MTSPQPQARDEVERLVAELAELRAYLDGTGDLDGMAFGEALPVSHGFIKRYWWRKHLGRIDQATSTLQAQARELEVMRRALKVEEALSRNDVELMIALGWSPEGFDTGGEYSDKLRRAALNSGGAG